MDDMIELFDTEGRKIRIPKSEFLKQVTEFARSNWESLDSLRPLVAQLLQTGFPREALELAERACVLSRGHVNDLYWQAACKAEMGMLQQAETEFAELQEDAAYPSDQARAAVGLARVKAKLGDFEAASALLEWAVETDPDNHAPMIALWSFWAEQGQPDAGVARINQMAHRFPDSPAPYRALTHAAFREGERDDLLTHGREAVGKAVDDEREDVLAEVSWFFNQCGMLQETIELLVPMLDDIHHPHALMNLLHAYSDLGRKEEAKALLQRMMKEFPPEMLPMLRTKLHELE